jgi:cell division protein FtsL
MRFLSLLAFGFLSGLVILIYDMKFETRRLEDRAAQLERAIEDEKDNIALMRAEWSHVSRPENIETLARDVLKLEPAKAEQLVSQGDFLALLSRRPNATTASNAGGGQRDAIGALIRDRVGGEGHGPQSSAP